MIDARASTVDARTVRSALFLVTLIGVAVGCRSVREPGPATPVPAPTDAAVTSTPDANPDVATTVVVSDAGAVGCSQYGKPCNAHCAEMAARYLAIAPDGSGTCDPMTCASVGGACAYGGFCFGQACIRRTHDGGAACSDRSECESKACFASASAKPGPGGGRCSGVVLNLGCHAPVEHGVIGATICGD